MSKTLTDEARSLIEALYKPAPFWQRSSRDKLSTLELISKTGDPAAIPDLANLLFDSNKAVMQAAADTMLILSESLTPSDMPWLDELVRERSPYRWSYPSAWADLKPDQLSRLKGLGSASVIAIGLASFHSSGYVREEALRLLSDIHDGTELPFLLLRSNDWVANVRDIAKQPAHTHRCLFRILCLSPGFAYRQGHVRNTWKLSN